MANPEYAKIGDKLYKINTDFKVALRCNEVYNSDVREEEKSLAIIYLLFGDDGLENPKDYEELLKKAIKFLLCDKEPKGNDNKEPNMDYEQDKSYIRASFYTDYQIPDIYKTDMHWWDFCDLMNGLTENCVLNRVRYIRDFDLSDIKDQKTLREWTKQKESVALKRKAPKMTKKQEESMKRFLEQLNYNRKED